MRLIKSPPEHRQKGRLIQTLTGVFGRFFMPEILYCEYYQLLDCDSGTVRRRLPPLA
jgi:hypothetical protein